MVLNRLRVNSTLCCKKTLVEVPSYFSVVTLQWAAIRKRHPLLVIDFNMQVERYLILI